MKNELEYIKVKYFNKNTEVATYCENITDKLLSYIKNGVPYEKPDFYFMEGDICYVFEHFQFDASKHLSKKGSSFKRA